MAALDFPIDPTDGDVYENYVWVAALDAWRRLPIDPAIPLGNLEDVTLTSPATDEVLKYDGTKWVNGPDEGGKILQVVSASTNTSVVSSSTSYFSIGSASITPTSATSKILIFSAPQVQINDGSNFAFFTIFRGDVSTGLNLATPQSRLAGAGRSGGSFSNFTVPVNSFDQPSTTSATTYTVAAQIAISGSMAFQTDGSYRNFITLIEVAG